MARWLLRLSEFQFNIIYRRGKSHNNADACSRYPFDKNINDDHQTKDNIHFELLRHKNKGTSTDDLDEVMNWLIPTKITSIKPKDVI